MESLYKVGDTVKIKQLSKKDSDLYRYGLNLEMVRQSGETFEIAEIYPASLPRCEDQLPDDGFKYTLKGSGWSWVSSMFEKSTKSKNKKSKIKISFHKKRKIQFDFSL